MEKHNIGIIKSKNSDVIDYFGLKKANLIGTNCPKGAIPLVGWSDNSTLEQKNAAGVGYQDPRFIGNNNEFAGTSSFAILTAQQSTNLASTDSATFT